MCLVLRRGRDCNGLRSVTCPDCFGEGRQSAERTDWHPRDIERNPSGGTNGSETDIRWLIHELRKSREALVHSLARCQDESAGQPESAAAVQFAPEPCARALHRRRRACRSKEVV